MTAYPWRAALTRWGDTLFKFALLLTDDRTAAERATIQAFTRSFTTPEGRAMNEYEINIQGSGDEVRRDERA